MVDVEKSYEAELVRYRQQRTHSNRNKCGANRHSRNFGLQIKRMEYENPLHSIQVQAARFRGLMQRKPEDRKPQEPKTEERPVNKRVATEKRDSPKRTKQHLKSSVEMVVSAGER